MACASIMRIWLLIILLCMGAGGIKLCLCNNIEPAEGRRCIESERRALLDVGGDICDSAIDWLSSWRNEGDCCCSWRGIGCDDSTGRVTSLDLRGSYDLLYPICASKLSPSLFGLTHLKHLDLSLNNFSGAPIPELIGSLVKLEYLNLSYAYFGGKVPHQQLGNLSNLHSLDFSGNYYYPLYAVELHWLSQTTSLSYLDLSRVDLSGAVDWIHDINIKLPSLSVLKLRGCGLSSEVPKLQAFGNFTRSLTVLDLSFNTLPFPLPTWTWLFNISSLTELDLSGNNIEGQMPSSLWRLCSLRKLGLSYNRISGEVPGITEGSSICKKNMQFGTGGAGLEYLHLGSNNLSGEFPKHLGQLSSLKYLFLGGNSFEGVLRETYFANLTRLEQLDLSDNHFHGTIPNSFANLTRLKYLDLSYNRLHGTIPNIFANLTRLEILSLSNNRLHGTMPNIFANPTRLEALDLSYNRFHGTIPNSFANLARLEYLSLSYNQFHGTIPNIFANLTRLEYLFLSYNRFHGTMPNFNFSVLQMVDLSGNSFFGSLTLPLIPIAGGALEVLILSQNRLNGSMPMSLCNFTSLTALDLSNNKLTGRVPPCLNMSTRMEVLDLSNNSLTGWIPASIGSLTKLQSLHLGNNDLLGRIPKSMKHCNQLVTLDLSENRLSGPIPAWIGKSLSSLRVLSLRRNQFCGAIPGQLAHLASLQLLDLSHNNLSGTISIPFGNFTAMVTVQVYPHDFLTRGNATFYYIYNENLWLSKDGQYLHYSSVLKAVTAIDISSNSFSGEFPRELTLLSGLVFLNMSNNHFTGHIPENIGGMGQLQLLDLSTNDLSGKIPSSISNLNFLSHLNLSCNKLSGRIPSGNQLQTLPANSYNGNDGLCGLPLQQCLHEQQPDQGKETHDDKSEEIWIYAVSALGFVVGFWASFGPILTKQSVRRAYFSLVDKLFDRVYVALAVNFRRLKTMVAQKSNGRS